MTDAFRSHIEENGRKLIAQLDHELHIVGERYLLSQILVNLIENAMWHTPVGTTIGVTLSRTADRIHLIVKDDGSGISVIDRARVIERFVRPEASRSKKGHGLGLSLVKAIATAHEAELIMEDNAPGLCIHLSFTTPPIRDGKEDNKADKNPITKNNPH